MIKVYLDNCSLNRPYDDQNQIRIKLEAIAKLFVQDLIVNNKLNLIWSYILDFENSRNPYIAKQNTITDFLKYSHSKILANEKIISMAKKIQKEKIRELDALHIACAIYAKSDFFITVDDEILKYKNSKIKIVDPIEFIKIYKKGGGLK